MKRSDTIQSMSDRAKAEKQVIVLAFTPDGAMGYMPMGPEFFNEAPEIAGPELVRSLKLGHDELLLERAKRESGEWPPYQ